MTQKKNVKNNQNTLSNWGNYCDNEEEHQIILAKKCIPCLKNARCVNG